MRESNSPKTGGACNNDAIDNSAGVDCSDHEVNVKILLDMAIADGVLESSARNRLLAGMTQQITALVLRNNYLQTQSISEISTRAPSLIDFHQKQIRAMERAEFLDRLVEFLPDDEEIDQRREKNLGLTRPEIAILTSYTKNYAFAEILGTELPDLPALESVLFRYFPASLGARFPEQIRRHPLRREIISTLLANAVIGRAGPGFLARMQPYGDTAQAARAFLAVAEIFNLRELWRRIEALDNTIEAKAQMRMHAETWRTLHRICQWLLVNESDMADLPRIIDKYGGAVRALSPSLRRWLPPTHVEERTTRIARFSYPNVPVGLAVALGSLKILSSTCAIVRIAERVQAPLLRVAAYYFRLAERLSLDRLRTEANAARETDSPWAAMAFEALIGDLWATQSELALCLFRQAGSGRDLLAQFEAARREQFKNLDDLLEEFGHKPGDQIARLTLYAHNLRELLRAKDP